MELFCAQIALRGSFVTGSFWARAALGAGWWEEPLLESRPCDSGQWQPGALGEPLVEDYLSVPF